jgi:hypothetical protein
MEDQEIRLAIKFAAEEVARRVYEVDGKEFIGQYPEAQITELKESKAKGNISCLFSGDKEVSKVWFSAIIVNGKINITIDRDFND